MTNKVVDLTVDVIDLTRCVDDDEDAIMDDNNDDIVSLNGPGTDDEEDDAEQKADDDIFNLLPPLSDIMDERLPSIADACNDPFFAALFGAVSHVWKPGQWDYTCDADDEDDRLSDLSFITNN